MGSSSAQTVALSDFTFPACQESIKPVQTQVPSRHQRQPLQKGQICQEQLSASITSWSGKTRQASDTRFARCSNLTLQRFLRQLAHKTKGARMASKKAQPNGHAEALLRKRLEVVRGLREQLSNPNSVASQTVTAYSELLDGTPALSTLAQPGSQ